MELLTEPEIISAWKLTTDKELRVFKRMLNPNLPRKVCPKYIDPKHIIEVGGVYKFKYDLEKGWPRILVKPFPSSAPQSSANQSN